MLGLQVIPLATTRSLILDKEVDGFGALIIARNDSMLSSVSDLAGAVISLPVLQGTACFLPAKLMLQNGLHLMQVSAYRSQSANQNPYQPTQ
jgi:hypothetical protein